MAGDRRGLGLHPLHQVAVRADRVDAVIDELVVRPVVPLGEEPLSDRHPDAVREALAERPRRRLDALRVPALRVPERGRAPLAEALQLLEREVVPREVQGAVLEDARVPRREDEPVAVRPVRVRRGVVHHLHVEKVGKGGERHGGPWVPGVRVLHRIHREGADRVDRELFDVRVRHGALHSSLPRRR